MYCILIDGDFNKSLLSSQSTEQLGRISEDLRSVNADLSLRVVDLRRRLSCCAGSSSEEIDAGGDNVVHVVVNRDGTSSSCSSGFGDIASNAGDEMDDGMIDVCMAAADQVRFNNLIQTNSLR